ncbi:MAG TPA: hypothetical protein VKT29_04965 [Terriglobales bacterium]|nr:hypothetical protein [Terriglobales bacterium]
MGLHELHPFTDAEIETIPGEAGVYVLFQVENPLEVGGTGNLRQHLAREKKRLPQATHFAVELGYKSEPATADRVRKLLAELSRVRVRGFVGSSE